MHEKEDDFSEPNFWHVFVSQRCWMPGEFDPLVRPIAVDGLTNIMIVALDCRWLIHPSDGGMDVFVESMSARDELKARYPEWLSARADGL